MQKLLAMSSPKSQIRTLSEAEYADLVQMGAIQVRDGRPYLAHPKRDELELWLAENVPEEQIPEA